MREEVRREELCEREEMIDKSERKQKVKSNKIYIFLFTVVLQCHHTFKMAL